MLQELNADQRRWLIDTQQAFEAWSHARIEGERRFAGGMRWVSRSGTDYLLRKTGKSETSLGPRSRDTEVAYDAFVRGREDNRTRLRSLTARLDEFAPVNVALELGRVPQTAARILRRCHEAGILGNQVFVVGTNAIFAYEAMAGVFIDGGLLATADIDLLYDARRTLSLAFDDIRERGLIGLLKQVDRSFSKRGYRATNDDGYIVDLIRPEAKDVFRDRLPASLSKLPDDLAGAPIFGLQWLVNAPKVEAVSLDERGYPVRITAIDPRVFASHKMWLAKRPDRDPLKVRRDVQQARAAAAIAMRYLRLPLENGALSALPLALRNLLPEVRPDREDRASTEPRW